MSKKLRYSTWRPFLSLSIAVSGLLVVVFAKMEVRRLGYTILQDARVESQLRDEKRSSGIFLAKVTRPQRVQIVAQSRLTFHKPSLGQIIQMTDQGIALRQ